MTTIGVSNQDPSKKQGVTLESGIFMSIVPTNHTMESYWGDIHNAINKAIAWAIELQAEFELLPKPQDSNDPTVREFGNPPQVVFDFNGVMVFVRHDSDAKLIYRDWKRATRGYISRMVVPYPIPVLTDEELENDARIKDENELRWRRSDSARKGWRTRRINALAAKLADAPEMEIADEAAWQSWKDNNNEGYGGGIIAYAERWARLMQVEMASGKDLEDIASATSHEADTDGITGFMYGAAVHTLATSWEYGEALRKWHNERYGAADAEGTVNPAVLVIATD